MTIADQIQLVRLNIAEYCVQSGRSIDSIRLLAVSKTHSASDIKQAIACGLTDFGENQLKEALNKMAEIKNERIQWHFIGPIQSNKTRLIAENFDWVQSVDNEKVLRRLSHQRPSNKPALNICIQANLFNEPQKKGCTVSELPELLDLASSLTNIKLRGLMVIPPKQTEYSLQSAQFEAVAKRYQNCQLKYPVMDTLSMGMSGDIKAAIHAGSDMVRVGTAIFGLRDKDLIYQGGDD